MDPNTGFFEVSKPRSELDAFQAASSRLLPPPDPCFLVDCMLGRLARWLRILGYDTLYFRQVSDRDLIAIHRSSGRTLLTRDTLLLRHEPGPHLFIKENHWKAQLVQVLFALDLKIVAAKMFTRCLNCNRVLQPLAPAEVKGRVPEFVALTVREFRGCAFCKKVYWPGTHRDHIVGVVAGIIQKAKT